LIVSSEDLPSLLAHEAGWGSLTRFGHSAHAGAGDEFEIILVAAWATEEFHSLVNLVVGSNLEGENLNTIKHLLHVDEELLTVPDIVAVILTVGVFHTSGVATSDEVGNTAVNTG